MKHLIHETQHCAPTSVYSQYHLVDQVVIEAHETYQKRSLRNKCIIMGANGPITLSIPLVKGKHSSRFIKDVKISYHDSWVGNYLHSIRSSFGAAPYYEYYYQELEAILKSNTTFLWDLNQELMSFIMKRIRLDTSIIESSEYQKEYDETWIDIRSQSIKSYQPEPSQEEGYAQVFEDRFGFVSNLSILDTLFCLGPESGLYLSRSKR